jgi:putative oxidoreductase
MKQSILLKQNVNTSTWLMLIRITLGVLLIWKGLTFIQDTSHLQVALQSTAEGGLTTFASVTAAVVGIGTLLSGIFVMVGFFTRQVSYTQIGIVFVALAFVYFTSIERTTLEMITTGVIFLLMALVAVYGSGSASFDNALQNAGERESSG